MARLDTRKFHTTAADAVDDGACDTYEAFVENMRMLSGTSAFVAGLFESDGSLKKFEPAPEKTEDGSTEPDLSGVETIEEAVAAFAPEVTKKRRAMALLLTGKWGTIEIRDAIKASEALISQARKELQRMKEAGLITDLPENVTAARSLAKKGKPRPDLLGDKNPMNKSGAYGSKGRWNNDSRLLEKARLRRRAKASEGQF